MENDSECLLCSEDLRDYRQRQRDMEPNAKKQNEFFRQLETSNSDGFSVISYYFSLGLFNKQSDYLSDSLADVPSLDPNLLKGLDL